MHDMLAILKQARNLHPFSEPQTFRETLNDICAKDASLAFDWDEGAGEAWAILTHDSQGIVCIMHSKLRLAFVRNTYNFRQFANILDRYQLVSVENYSTDEWEIDLTRLSSEIPEIVWHASPYAVNPACFCLMDFHYATV